MAGGTSFAAASMVPVPAKQAANKGAGYKSGPCAFLMPLDHLSVTSHLSLLSMVQFQPAVLQACSQYMQHGQQFHPSIAGTGGPALHTAHDG